MDRKDFARAVASMMSKNDQGLKTLFTIKMVRADEDRMNIAFEGLQELASKFRVQARDAYAGSEYETHKGATDSANRAEALYDEWNGRDSSTVTVGEVLDASQKFAAETFPGKLLIGAACIDENGLNYQLVIGPSQSDVLTAANKLSGNDVRPEDLN